MTRIIEAFLHIGELAVDAFIVSVSAALLIAAVLFCLVMWRG